jgi:hypothetical protein
MPESNPGKKHFSKRVERKLQSRLIETPMISISIRPLPIRIFFRAVLLTGLGLLAWPIIRAAIGDSVMTYVQRSPNLAVDSQIAGADMAARYSPHDPTVRWRRGGVYLNAANENLEEARIGTAIEEFQTAVKMSPKDYRAWLSLGRALDRAGETDQARKAIERAVALAPNHFEPRWVFGNHLLRAGDREASFAQMRLALAYRPSALSLIFDYAWSVFNGDGKAVIAAIDPPTEIKPKMIPLLVNKGRADDALALWRTIPNPAAGDIQNATAALVNAGYYRKGFEIWNSANIPDRPAPDPGSLLSNGGFESKTGTAPFYNWQILTGGMAKVFLDRKKPAAGQQALRVGFEVRDNIPISIASQTIPARPSTTYRLTFKARSEDLESLSNPFVELYDPALELGVAGRPRAATQPFRTNIEDWADYEIELRTGPQTEALKVRIQRLPGDPPPCPINGRLWLDDFKLVAVNAKEAGGSGRRQEDEAGGSGRRQEDEAGGSGRRQ